MPLSQSTSSVFPLAAEWFALWGFKGVNTSNYVEGIHLLRWDEELMFYVERAEENSPASVLIYLFKASIPHGI